MRRIWNEVKAHRLATILFLLYWVIAFGLDAFGWRKPKYRPEDMGTTVIYLHFLLPVIAGASIGWWRRNTPGRIAGGMVAAEVVLIVDAAAVLAHQWIAFHMGETGGSGERITEVPVFLMAIALMGSLLGLIGAAGGAARLLVAVACLAGAACNLGAGILALVAAFRRHERSCGGPLPVS